jgi:hypothetical protein
MTPKEKENLFQEQKKTFSFLTAVSIHQLIEVLGNALTSFNH